jgi:nucleolar MIF4G domain-containing protein 1
LAVNEVDEAALLALARARRMNTDLRRSIFCVLYGASDFLDAYEKLCKLNLHGSQDREVARILMDSCGAEPTYNPFFAYLAEHLCRFEKHYRFTFQLAFWDVFKLVGDAERFSTRRAVNLGRLLGHLMAAKMLPLATIKALEFDTLPRNGVFLVHTALEAVLTNAEARTIFSRLGEKGKEAELVRDALSFFFHRFMGYPSKSPPQLTPLIQQALRAMDEGAARSELRREAAEGI